MTSAPITEVRTVLSSILGEARLRAISDTDELLQSGVISSIELVEVAVGLEEHFHIKIPDAQVTPEHFSSIQTIGTLVANAGAGDQIGSMPVKFTEPNRLVRSAVRVVRRPLLFAAAALISFIAIDLILAQVMKGPLADYYTVFNEAGSRLYPVGGTYSQDDLDFAVSTHAILADPTVGAPRIAVFGDSGTIGSYVPADAAIPAQIEAGLREISPNARVFNLAFFMQFLAKDLMILEALLERNEGRPPFDVAVFTLGEAYFYRQFIDRLMKAMPYLSLNWSLLERYGQRIGGDDALFYQRFASELRDRSSMHYRIPPPWLVKYSALYHYGPFFRYLITEVLRSKAPFDYAYSVGRRPLLSPVPERPPAGFEHDLMTFDRPDEQIDHRVLPMLKSTIRFLRQHGVDTVLYLKPKAPREWREQQRSGQSIADIAAEVCADLGCRIVDARWELSGSEFTDSLAHYNADANRRVGGMVAEVLREGKHR